MDKIILRKMRFNGICGVFAEEKELAQPFLITITLEIPRIPACDTDDLNDTVDYGKVFALTKEVVEQGSYDLIEYMAGEIVRKTMASSGIIHAVTVLVEKPDAPIDGDFKSMAVEIRRTRDELEDAL